MVGLLILAGLVLAGVVAWGLHKANKPVTVGSVTSGVETDLKTAANTVVQDVANTVVNKL